MARDTVAASQIVDGWQGITSSWSVEIGGPTMCRVFFSSAKVT